ncbi:MAG: DinB family protein [Vicinamibacterales bacterium]
MSPEVTQLLAIIDQAYDTPSWHGTNLRGSIRRVTPARAAWRPGPGRHNIWEIVVHTAYWKYAAARRLTGGARGSFPLKGSNWFRRPAEPDSSSGQSWKHDLALLDDMHDALRTAVGQLSARDLPRTPPGKKVSNFALLSGVAAHDLYHAGQIQLLKRLSAPSATA